jgi:hypothetical protein
MTTSEKPLINGGILVMPQADMRLFRSELHQAADDAHLRSVTEPVE